MAEPVPNTEREREEEPSNYGDLKPGTQLGRYQLLLPIARGGMARVWAARLQGQRGFQKLVAVKVILPHLAEEPEFERMFLDEARIAAGVHHSNVCEIYELGEDHGVLYLAMEWVSGDSLSRVLRAQGTTDAIDPRVAARILADVCAGVHAAHELTDDDGRSLGVVHRDLSPHNILITADGTSKVCDFGVAKAFGQLHEATNVGQLKGKLAYMAPEQVTGAPIDRRSDVFSLGCVLYEATTGLRPFRGEGDHQVMHALLEGDVALPTNVMRGYPAPLEEIVMRALAPQPAQRFPTAERMRLALEEFLARGQLVTQANVAQLLRARIGASLDRRKERIRRASAVDAEGRTGDGVMTPSGAPLHRSGVQVSMAGVSSTPPPVQPRESSAPSAFAHSSHTLPPDSRSGSLALPPLPVPFVGGGAPPPPPLGAEPWPAPPPPPPPAAQYAIAIGGGALLALVLGTLAFFWQRGHREPGALSERAVAVEPVEPVAPVRASTIEIQGLSPDATLEVDGRSLGGSHSIPRPLPGRAASVVVRAAGYQDATVVVDFATVSPMVMHLDAVPPETTLLPTNTTPTADAKAARPAPRDDLKNPPREPPRKVHPLPPKDPGPLPANPY